MRDLSEEDVRAAFKKFAVRRACCTSVDRAGVVQILEELSLPKGVIDDFNEELEKHKGFLKLDPFMKVRCPG